MSRFQVRAVAAVMALLALVLIAPSTTAAVTDQYWSAAYWQNARFSGEPVGYLQHESIAFDWGENAPFQGAFPGDFAFRWTRKMELTAGTYRMITTADDGIIVRVDGQIVINDFKGGPARTTVVDKTLTAGTHEFQIDYYNAGGTAVAFFNIVPVSTSAAVAPTTGWYGQYYLGTNLSGSPVFTRIDPALNFDWGGDKPISPIFGQYEQFTSDSWSARWTRNVSLAAGTYQFNVTVDDGVRIYVNGTKVLDEWTTRQAETFQVNVQIPGGTTRLMVEYFENTANAQLVLDYYPVGGTGVSVGTGATGSTGSTGSTGGEVGGGGAPEGVTAGSAGDPGTGGVIVDNASAGFVKGGPDGDFVLGTGGYNGSFLVSYNSATEAAYYNWARWFPALAAGNYDIYVFIPATDNLTTNARYWVRGATGYTRVYVNQKANAGQWVSLGTFALRGDGFDFVSVSDVTGETGKTTLVAFDAIQFVAR